MNRELKDGFPWSVEWDDRAGNSGCDGCGCGGWVIRDRHGEEVVTIESSDPERTREVAEFICTAPLMFAALGNALYQLGYGGLTANPLGVSRILRETRTGEELLNHLQDCADTLHNFVTYWSPAK